MIIDNLLYLFDYINQHNEKQIWIRTPIIPGFTDSEKNISDIADFLHEHSNKSVSRWELCAFNNACNKKYKQLGKKWLLEGAPLITNRKLQQLKAVAEQSGIESIITSGITILE